MYTHELTGLLELYKVSRLSNHKQADSVAWGTVGLAWLGECLVCYDPTAAAPMTLLNGRGGGGGGGAEQAEGRHRVNQENGISKATGKSRKRTHQVRF